jgi:hypothetical protein
MEYVRVHNTHLHFATLYSRRNKELVTARNQIGSRGRGCGWSDRSLHAERAVVKALGDTSLLSGCTLLVVRIGKDGSVMPSKPCYDCTLFLNKCMRQYGLRRVVYSD